MSERGVFKSLPVFIDLFILLAIQLTFASFIPSSFHTLPSLYARPHDKGADTEHWTLTV